MPLAGGFEEKEAYFKDMSAILKQETRVKQINQVQDSEKQDQFSSCHTCMDLSHSQETLILTNYKE